MSALDMTDSIVPRSDQINAEDLLAGPRTVTITEVRKGNAEQPFDFHLAEFPGRPFRPSKTVRRVLVNAWGQDAATYPGRRMTLFRDPAVKWAGQEVGGIRISHLSHINKPLTLALTVTKGKRETSVIKPLKDEPAAVVPDYVADAQAAQDIAGWRQVWQRAQSAGHLNDALKAKLTPIGEALKAEPQKQPVEEPPAEGDDWPETATIPGTDGDR